MGKLIFASNAPASDKAEVARRFAEAPGTAPRDIVNYAATDLGREAKDLAFKTGKSYEECSRHLMSQNPWLALATAAIDDSGRSAEALGIEIVTP